MTHHEKLCHKLKILKIVLLVQLECADYNHCLAWCSCILKMTFQAWIHRCD